MTGRFQAVLVDLGGVVYVGETPLPGSIAALDRLRNAGLARRYITNTTRLTRAVLLEKLSRIGLDADPDELFTPARAALDYLRAHDLDPCPLVHPSLAPEFRDHSGGGGRALVVGDAGDAFTYHSLNEAFQVLESGAEFLALAKNRYFRKEDGGLQLDAGPFVAALEFAARRTATVLGKPSEEFFRAAVDSVGAAVERTVMVGDDVESDVAGAMLTGMKGILVKTGKYQTGDETAASPAPDFVADDLAAAVDWILHDGMGIHCL